MCDDEDDNDELQGLVVLNSIVLIVLVTDQDDGQFLERGWHFHAGEKKRKDSEVKERQEG